MDNTRMVESIRILCVHDHKRHIFCDIYIRAILKQKKHARCNSQRASRQALAAAGASGARPTRGASGSPCASLRVTPQSGARVARPDRRERRDDHGGGSGGGGDQDDRSGGEDGGGGSGSPSPRGAPADAPPSDHAGGKRNAAGALRSARGGGGATATAAAAGPAKKRRGSLPSCSNRCPFYPHRSLQRLMTSYTQVRNSTTGNQ
jgi:hypothetical protein